MRNLSIIAILLGSLPLAGLAAPCGAQQRASVARDGSSKDAGRVLPDTKAKMPLAITPEREAAVMTFVGRNHSELSSLLELLKENRRKEYERAIRELYRVTEKLATIQERDREQYELELQAWQVQSRIQLLVARLKMADSDDVRHELKEAVGEQLKARTALLRHERERVARRLERIDRDLGRLENDSQDWIDKQFAALVKNTSGAKARPRKLNAKQPAEGTTQSSPREEKTKKSPTAAQTLETNGSKKP